MSLVVFKFFESISWLFQKSHTEHGYMRQQLLIWILGCYIFTLNTLKNIYIEVDEAVLNFED